jgi:YHS domain-containing protein
MTTNNLLLKYMKTMNQYLLLGAFALGATTFTVNASAGDMPACCMGMTMADTNTASTNAIPDLLKTCPVSGEKLGSDDMTPYVFSYQGQEVKLCCKGCKKDFDKNPDKYIKAIRAADKKS